MKSNSTSRNLDMETRLKRDPEFPFISPKAVACLNPFAAPSRQTTPEIIDMLMSRSPIIRAVYDHLRAQDTNPYGDMAVREYLFNLYQENERLREQILSVAQNTIVPVVCDE